MYFSQNAIILVMLMFVTSAVFYTTINYKTKAVEDEIKIKKVSLYESNLINTLERNIDKIVEDAFVNASYKIMKERRFFENKDDAINYITSYIKNETNKTLNCLKGNENLTYNISDVDINSTNNPKIVKVTLTVNIEYKKKLNNGEIIASLPVPIDKEVKLSRIPDPYVYLNKFYYTWEYYRNITVNNFPNDGENHTFCIILNNTNFNYSKMYNPSSPKEIRIVGWNSTSREWDILLPYWVQTWRSGANETSIIWVRCNKDNLFTINGNYYIKLLYNSTTPVDRQNPEETFILFDDFDYFNPDVWNATGQYLINDSKITVIAGAGSSVYTKQTYETGYELMFRAEFTMPNASQSIGFFKKQSDWIGVGWVNKNEWNGTKIYLYNGSGSGYYIGTNITWNDFYIYDMKRNDDGSIYGYIRYENFSTLLAFDPNSGYYPTSSDTSPYPISINAIPPNEETSNTNVTVDWIFLKDVNDITTTVGNNEGTNPEYKEEKPKTFTGTIYYGDPSQYTSINNGSYSIIGLYTNKTDSWGSVGYKPIIEEN